MQITFCLLIVKKLIKKKNKKNIIALTEGTMFVRLLIILSSLLEFEFCSDKSRK